MPINKILLGKSTNANLGHSGGKYGLWCTRGGNFIASPYSNEHDITDCDKDELIFSTDMVGNTSGAIDAGQYQVMPSSGTNADQAFSIAGGSSATLSFTDLNIDLIWMAAFGADYSVASGDDGAYSTYSNAQGYGTNQTSVSVSNTGNKTRTGRAAAIRGMKTGGLW